MPRDVPIQDESEWDLRLSGSTPIDRSAWGRPALVDRASAELREATLKREVARLSRALNRMGGPAGQPMRPPSPPEAGETAPPAGTTSHETDAARIAAKDALLRTIYASRSWRLMAPLRAVSRLLGRGPAPDVADAIARTDAAAEPGARVAIAPPAPDRLGASLMRRQPEGRSRGEVLVVAPHLPLFDRQSGGLRLKMLIGMIAALGWTVSFCATLPEDWGPEYLARPEGREGYEAALRASGVTHFVYGMEGIRAFLIGSGGRMRYAFLSFPTVASDVTPLIRSHCPWARIIYDTVDIHFRRMRREAELLSDPQLAQAAESMRQLELSCMRSADVTIAVTDEERRLLLDLVPESVVETLPNVFRLPPEPPRGPAGRAGLLFVGSFWHAPNGDAVLWFVEHVWPLIQAGAPGILFRIAGAEPTPEVLALGQRPGIEVLGYMPDLTPLFDAARVFVAPLRFGAGMKGKVGQSLVSGLPVVTTAIGAEGMSLLDGEHVLVADAAADFADQVLGLLGDDALWGHLQAQGRALIAATLSEAVVSRRLETLFRV